MTTESAITILMMICNLLPHTKYQVGIPSLHSPCPAHYRHVSLEVRPIVRGTDKRLLHMVKVGKFLPVWSWTSWVFGHNDILFKMRPSRKPFTRFIHPL